MLAIFAAISEITARYGPGMMRIAIALGFDKHCPVTIAHMLGRFIHGQRHVLYAMA